MSRRNYLFLFTILFLVLHLSCNRNKEKAENQVQYNTPQQQVQKEIAQTSDTNQATENSVTAEMIWTRLSSSDYRKNWKYFPGKPLYFMGSQHGRYLITYLNTKAYNAVNKGSAVLPYDSVLVTESYTPDNELEDIYVMQRVRGFNPEGGDWYWVKYSPDGTAQTRGTGPAGKVGSCINCHNQSTAGSEYIMK